MKATNMRVAAVGTVIVVALVLAACPGVFQAPPPQIPTQEAAPPPAETPMEEEPPPVETPVEEEPPVSEEGPEPTPVPRTSTLETYAEQVEQALPELDPSMLKVPEGEDWMAELTVEQVGEAVKDPTAPLVVYEEPPYYEARDEADTMVIKIDQDQGRVRYIGKLREFDWSKSSHKAVPEELAAEMTLETLSVLGVPEEELGELRVDTVLGQDMDQAAGGDLEPPFERERLVTAYRQINEYYVFENYARLAVSNNAEIARLLTIWPQFSMPSDLELTSRDKIVDIAANYINEAEKGIPVEVEIELAYIRTGYDYIPAAIVTFVDVYSGEIVAIPIVELPPDQDLDGIQDDEDNCVDDANPDQLDGDQDGVGDDCDNCPDEPNAEQDDADGNGIGDECDPGEEEEEGENE